MVHRARRIERFLSQPFLVAEVFTGKPGEITPLADTIRSFEEICDGKWDHLLRKLPSCTWAPSSRCIVVTPEQTVLDTEAEFVALPLFDGELGVAPHHAPMIGRLGFGELRIRRSGQTDQYYVDGGFVQVADNLVSVLTNRAEPAKALDQATIQAAITATLSEQAAGDEAIGLRDRALAQSRAQLRVAQRAK